MISSEALRAVDEHWAVLAIGTEKRDRALAVADAVLVELAVGDQLSLDFHFRDSDGALLDRLATAYEVAAVEGLHALLNPSTSDDALRQQCVAGAWRAFQLRRLLELPRNDDERIREVLHLSALAYCGDRWSDLRRWYSDVHKELTAPSVAEVQWDRRLLYRLFDCWLRLFRKNGWDDLDRIREIIAGLREDQRRYEEDVLSSTSNAKSRATALRLVAFYHWAKATEMLAVYMMQGNPGDVMALLNKHFDAAVEAAGRGQDATFEVLLRWLHAAGRQMLAGSLWMAARGINSRIADFIEQATKHGLFELLPPQRAALMEQGLLDTASTAVAVELPTSGGKTLLAQFRILQALNQFDSRKGWVAYVAPTRALSSQITLRLRRDFGPIDVKVEQLTGAVEIDSFEEDLLEDRGTDRAFDVLVATPEKLQLVLRNKRVSRPIALIVLDEAHNIEEESRGLRIELLLATVKRECKTAHFLLLMPYVPKADALARWLADDVSAGRSISIGTTPWQPNERIVGMFRAVSDESMPAGWHLRFRTLSTTPKTLHLKGDHSVGDPKPLPIPKSKVLGAGKQKGLGIQTAAIAKVMSARGTSIAVANRIDTVWKMGRALTESLGELRPLSDEIKLVQRFLQTEIDHNFELVRMLSRGIGVHHAGLSDEARTLIEWLAENEQLKVLCATSTIAQGINFPVSSVFLSSRFIHKQSRSVEMLPRDFWNLAGRAGRMDHSSVGVVGLAEGQKAQELRKYVSSALGELASRLEGMVERLCGNAAADLDMVIRDDQWEDFRCYVAHLWNEKQSIDEVLADTDRLLRNTYGYTVLRGMGSSKADALLDVTRGYARHLAKNPGTTELADSTGFSPEGVRRALTGISQLDKKLTVEDWTPGKLFGRGRNLADLFGVMMRIPQLKQLAELAGPGTERRHLAAITNAWVNGVGIREIASRYFRHQGTADTDAITAACRAIYRNLVNTGTWGVSALSHLCGIDYDSLPESDRRRINSIPAMIYHGVKTEEAVLMRMNHAPRSVAEDLGREFAAGSGDKQQSVQNAREFLRSLSTSDWARLRPRKARLTGPDYRTIWRLLAGETR